MVKEHMQIKKESTNKGACGKHRNAYYITASSSFSLNHQKELTKESRSYRQSFYGLSCKHENF